MSGGSHLTAAGNTLDSEVVDRGETLGTGYGQAPKTGYASQVTGGTGTTALYDPSTSATGTHESGLGHTGQGAGYGQSSGIGQTGGYGNNTSATPQGLGYGEHASSSSEMPSAPGLGNSARGVEVIPAEHGLGNSLADTPDTNQADPLHDPVNMGYGENRTNYQL